MFNKLLILIPFVILFGCVYSEPNPVPVVNNDTDSKLEVSKTNTELKTNHHSNTESIITIDMDEFYDESAITASNTAKLIIENSNFEIGLSSEFYIKSQYSSSLILEKGKFKLFRITFNSKIGDGINDLPFTSVVYFKKEGELFEVTSYAHHVSSVYNENWNGDVAEFYIDSYKYCIDINAAEYTNFECMEYDAEAILLNPDDGFYILGLTYLSRGGHLGNDAVEGILQDYVDLNEQQIVSCVLGSDKRINVDQLGQDNKFTPYVTQLCASSPGVLAGPFQSELHLTNSVDEQGFGGWHFYKIIYCKKGDCYYDYSAMDTTYIAPPEPPAEPKVFSKVVVDVKWVEPNVETDLTNVEVYFYHFQDDYSNVDFSNIKEEDNNFWSCNRLLNYFELPTDECRRKLKEHEKVYQFPSDISLEQGVYMVKLLANIGENIGGYGVDEVNQFKILEIGRESKDLFLNFILDKSDIAYACPYIYTNLKGKDVFQGEIIMNLNHKNKEATQSLPIEFEVKNGLVEILIKEVKDETSYINYLALEVSGELFELDSEQLKEIDDKRVILKVGESMTVKFKLPAKLHTSKSGNLISHGYYVPNH
ncbi:MAG: hypothetical protein HRU38_19045 [Saccharospirillaceae bacterium]|nr:hypothetical protein [Pseudomonadales bacterium]NRB80732.1 hypothetical protein [Saccharospirillaceae bacterium]